MLLGFTFTKINALNSMTTELSYVLRENYYSSDDAFESEEYGFFFAIALTEYD